MEERRRNPHVSFVRDWITNLRRLGGDFDPEAARVAGDAAYKAMRTGAPEESVFDSARFAYYNHLKQSAPERDEFSRPA